MAAASFRTSSQLKLGSKWKAEKKKPAGTFGPERLSALLPERVSAVRNFLRQTPAPVPPEIVARNFVRARSPEVSAVLETVVALGQARKRGADYWI
jgi:hypothetical protein